jgi:hypothetical protein
VLDENFFMEIALRSSTLRGLSDAGLEVYRAPYGVGRSASAAPGSTSEAERRRQCARARPLSPAQGVRDRERTLRRRLGGPGW